MELAEGRFEEALDLAARLLAAQPQSAERVQRILVQHRRHRDGKCTGCGPIRLTTWPCFVASAAMEAQRRIR